MRFAGTIVKDGFLKRNFSLLLPVCCILLLSCTNISSGDGNEAAVGMQSVTGPVPQQENVSQKDPSLRENVPQTDIPEKVYQTLEYVRKNKVAPDGFAGGRHFGNYERRLPERDAAGNKIAYREWDVNPKTPGRGRGPQRLVTGSDGSAWYTGNHYQSFTEIRRHADIQQ